MAGVFLARRVLHRADFFTFYLAWGAQYINAKGLCGFDTPEFRAALQFYTDIYTKYN